MLTLLETVTTALVARGLDPDASNWDAWRNEDGRWTVQLAWKAGLSDNIAHFCFTPGAHGGTATAFDDAASELIDPDFARALRPVAAVRRDELEDDEPQLPLAEPEPEPKPQPPPQPEQEAPDAPAPRARRARDKPAGAGVGGRAARRALGGQR